MPRAGVRTFCSPLGPRQVAGTSALLPTHPSQSCWASQSCPCGWLLLRASCVAGQLLPRKDLGSLWLGTSPQPWSSSWAFGAGQGWGRMGGGERPCCRLLVGPRESIAGSWPIALGFPSSSCHILRGHGQVSKVRSNSLYPTPYRVRENSRLHFSAIQPPIPEPAQLCHGIEWSISKSSPERNTKCPPPSGTSSITPPPMSKA